MRKFAGLFILLVFILSLSSCGPSEKDGELKFSEAKTAYENEEYAKSTRLVQEALPAFKKNIKKRVELLTFLGESLGEEKKIKEAESAFKEALSESEKLPDFDRHKEQVYFRFAQMYYRRNMLDNAMEQFNNAVRYIDKRTQQDLYLEVIYNQGVILEESKNYGRAEEKYKEIVKFCHDKGIPEDNRFYQEAQQRYDSLQQ